MKMKQLNQNKMGVVFLIMFGVLIFATRNNKSDYMKRKEKENINLKIE